MSIDFGSVGILQIGNERYGFRPTELYTEYGHAPIMKGEFLPDVFAVSNLKAKAVEYLAGMTEVAKDPEIKNVIFNDPATVVIWGDGTKTVVKCQPGDTYSKETGLALCIAKKYLGNKGDFNEVFKTWIPEEVEPVEDAIEVEDKETGAINLLRSGDIRVGDKVRVVRYGQTYTTYRDWVEDHVKDPADAAKWAEGGLMRDNDIGVVKYLASHERSYEGVIAYIEIDDKCYMINVVGLKKVEEISVEEMRNALDKFCRERLVCFTCPLSRQTDRCGNGTSFLIKRGESYDMTDDEIRDAYKIAFGGKG